MPVLLARQGVEPPSPIHPPVAAVPLPSHVAAALWHGDELGAAETPTVATGFDALDRELPGGGWPRQAVTELLSAQPTLLEWRLLAPALRHICASGKPIVVVGPPKAPHMPGLQQQGLDERTLVWVRADSPAERLWCTEQLIRSNACGALLAWLPQARPAQLRRLQVAAQRCEGLVVVCRPATARFEASAAPLRVEAGLGLDWELQLHILKRRGAVHEGTLRLPSVPASLASILTPRLRRPGALAPAREAAADVVGSIAPRDRLRPQQAAV